MPDVTQPVRITLPGVVHRFAEGHSVRLVLSAADATYKGFGLGGPVTVVDDPAAPNVLSLPVVAAQSGTRGRAGRGPGGAVHRLRAGRLAAGHRRDAAAAGGRGAAARRCRRRPVRRRS